MAHIIANIVFILMGVASIAVIVDTIRPKCHRFREFFDSELIITEPEHNRMVEYAFCGILIMIATIAAVAL